MTDDRPVTASESEDSVVRFNPEINMGALLQILAVASAAFLFIIRGDGKAERALEDVRGLKETITSTNQSARADVNAALGRVEGSISALQQQISNLPDVGARLTQVERRLDSKDAHAQQVDTRLNRQSEILTELRAEVGAMQRQVNQPLSPQQQQRERPNR